MLHEKMNRLVVLLIGVGAWCTLAGGAFAQDKKPFEKHDAAALNAALKDVINAGAEIYNKNGDHAGCYRVYEGALISVRPFVAPDLQKKIDASIKQCDMLGSYSERAFELRKVLDEIRERTKVPGEMKKGGDGDKKKEKKGDGDKKKEKIDSKDSGQVSGKVVFEGKPVTGGYSVALIGKGEKSYTADIGKDGTFAFKMAIPAGEYRVALVPFAGAKGPELPPRYFMAGTSGLAIRVQAGKQNVDLNLVK